jgi:enoyl-CoA hydratase/carnithine racemase
MKTNSALIVERLGHVLVLSNNDAPMNRMRFEYIDALESALADAAADPSVRVIVITAAGDANFSVGMDLKQLTLYAEERGGLEAVLNQRRRVLEKIESMNKPSIATLFGYCLGGGLELPLACHFRLVAAEGARIGLPEMELGTVPAWGGTVRLTRCVGRNHALDMILRARKIDGNEALRIGLVHAVHPIADLKAAALELARELAEKAPLAIAGALRSIVNSENLGLSEALDEERVAFLRCAASHDQAEGIKAFMEKRQPVFTGE